MTGGLVEIPLHEPLADALARPAQEGRVRVYWLGQAGFVIDAGATRIVIDPYLSDTLADKYRGTARPHERLMPAPIAPGSLKPLDLVLCTHHHTDHMDPGTLGPLMAANPSAPLVAPRAALAAARERSGFCDVRIRSIEAGETIVIGAVKITATRAAHETLEQDEDGNHRFLGYLIDTGALRIWHSGDCIPFEGLVDEVSAFKPGLALLPVNGRRSELSTNGVPGNFELDEAIGIARATGCGTMVAHHYGLFAFNTVDPETIDAASARETGIDVLRAREAIALEWRNR